MNSTERRLTPLVILVLLALLLLSLAGWVLDRVNRETIGPGALLAPDEVIRWKMVTTWPKNFPGLGLGPENFARLVREMSGGRLQVQVYGGGEIVPAFGVFDAVSQGVAEMGHGAGYYWTGKVPAAVFFTAVPFGFTADEASAWMHYGGGLEL